MKVKNQTNGTDCMVTNSGFFDISQFFSTLWKERRKRIWFQTKDDVIVRPGGIGSDQGKTVEDLAPDYTICRILELSTAPDHTVLGY